MNLPHPPLEYALRMPPHPEAFVLVKIGLDLFGRELLLSPETAKAWSKMQEQASCDGVQLLALSGYRSTKRQAELVEKKLSEGIPLDEILKVVAYPGFSEHHTGRAIDIGSPGSPHLEEAFEQTQEFQWLIENAGAFDFRLSYPRENTFGIIYEPWHWCWRGSGV